MANDYIWLCEHICVLVCVDWYLIDILGLHNIQIHSMHNICHVMQKKLNAFCHSYVVPLVNKRMRVARGWR